MGIFSASIGEALFCVAVLCPALVFAGDTGTCKGLKGPALSRCEEQEALGSMRYGSEEYKKAKLTCAICDDMRRTDVRPSRAGRPGRAGSGGSGGFVNKKLEDDLLRYRTAYGEHFQVKRCKENETKELCRKYRIAAEKGKKQNR